jgi:hypothetical protein
LLFPGAAIAIQFRLLCGLLDGMLAIEGGVVTAGRRSRGILRNLESLTSSQRKEDWSWRRIID